MAEDAFTTNARYSMIPDATPYNMWRLLKSSNWVGADGELAIKAVQLQLDTYYHNLDTRIPTPPTPTTLFDAAAQRIATLLAEDPDNLDTVLETINPAIARAVWSWPRIPYPAVCSIWRRVFRDNVKDIKTKDEVVNYTPDVDDWVIQNEDWLRQRLDDPMQDWRIGLVTLENCDDVFFSSTSFPSARQITRNNMDGWKCLDARRSKTIFIQPSINSFKEKFEEMTLGQLKGLDWSNVFIAGGIIVGSLLCTGDPSSQRTKEQWVGSDIDIYIYGLDPVQVNEKIKHIFAIFRNNLPEDAPTLVVRNSKTISFIPNFPQRRFQIILKLVKNPAEVLLNFDLDICAMGFDGGRIYMLPRAARALETGYNVFTMDMVQGHYLGTRRATQEHRVFKYAHKGYGIRILPSYLESLKRSMQLSTIEEEDQDATDSYERPIFEYKVARGRRYFERFWKAFAARRGSDSPEITHADLDTDYQKSDEPLRRSCLTGLELFYRHVCLWEAGEEGRVKIPVDVWRTETYEESYGVSYNELPTYDWDEDFEIDWFKERVSTYNNGLKDDLYDNSLLNTEKWEEMTPRRIIVASSLEGVMEENLSIPIWTPKAFLTFAREIVNKVSDDMPDLPFNECFEEISTHPKDETLVLVNFNLSPVTMFQQLDRRLDETFEAVWSFMHSNARMIASPENRTELLKRQLSRRALRRRSEDEYLDFLSWVERSPGGIEGYDYGPWGQGFWWEVAPKYRSPGHSEFDSSSDSD